MRLSDHCPCCLDAEDHRAQSTMAPWIYVVPKNLEHFVASEWPKLGATVVLGSKEYRRLDAQLLAWIRRRVAEIEQPPRVLVERLAAIEAWARGRELPAARELHVVAETIA